jgi:hypothetical protein
MTTNALRNSIASILDGNSVFMGGPSQGSLKKADKILELLATERDVLQRKLDAARTALEMVRDANLSEPHIPPAALAAINNALTQSATS